MADDPYVVSVERVIPAPPERIFPLLADPAKHREIDGSGTVREAKNVPTEPLHLGSQFGMNMKLGIPYSMVNTVIEVYLGMLTGPALLQALLVQVLWLVILVAASQLLMRAGVRKLVIQGG